MTMIFTHYDRTQMCNHQGMLTRPSEDGTRTCARCGTRVQTNKDKTFTRPTGGNSGRRSVRPAPR